jgi:cell division protein FtsN
VTDPNWIVELYVNNVLVDYVKADASGFFKFEVPLVYGNSGVMLRFYGPWGEEKTRMMNISIPFNFLPPGELEYNISAGIVEDALNSRFSRTTVNYGVTRRFTMGGGLEYLSSVITGAYMPFLNSSLRIGNNLLLSGEYTNNVRFKGLMSYRLPSNVQMEVDYTHYTRGQKAIIYNYLEERKAVVSVPFKSHNFSIYSRMTLNQIIMESMRNTNAELLLSGALYGVSTNFTTYGLFTNPANPYIYSNLSLALRLPHRFVLTPQIQYEYMNNEVIATRANLEKSIFTHGFFNLSYEQNFKSSTNIVEMGLRYDLPFAQTGFSARQSNEQTSFVESARGSLLYDSKNHFLGTNNRSSVGKGAITFVPFLDLNCNGRRDPDEPKVAGLNLRIDGGRMLVSEKDTTIRIVDLIPYTSYFVELNRNSFDNIAWQIKKQTMSINVDANQFKSVEIPVAVMGEVSGTVYERTKIGKAGKGRILINFIKNDSLVARAMSEADGYFSLLGLAPGPYQVRIDSVQLNKIGMKAVPASLPVTIKRSRDGDVIDGLEFTLNSISPVAEPELKTTIAKEEKKTAENVEAKKEPNTLKVQPGIADVPKGSSGIAMDQKGVPQGKIDSAMIGNSKQPVSAMEPVLLQGKVEIQAGAFSIMSNAGALMRRLEKATGRKCVIVTEDGLYKVRLSGFKDRIEAENYLPKVKALGLPEAFVVGYHEGIVIQVDAFVFEQNAKKVQQSLMKVTGRKVKIVHEDGFYKVRLDGFSGRKEAEAYLPGLIQRGYREAFIIVQ